MSLHEHRFAGSDYVPALDNGRLDRQIDRVRRAMDDGEWRTLDEIELITGDPQASISAQLRHLTKPRFGAWRKERRRRTAGTWEYRISGGRVE